MNSLTSELEEGKSTPGLEILSESPCLDGNKTVSRSNGYVSNGTSASQSLRALVRDGVFALTYYSGVQAIAGLFRAHRPRFLSFHNVLPASDISPRFVFSVDIDVETFRRQIRYLVSSWPVRPAEEVLKEDAGGLFLVFDDGMLNNYTRVLPILKEHGLTAVFAVCPGLISGDIPHLWRDMLYLLLHERIGSTVLLPDDDYRSEVPVSEEELDQIAQKVTAWVYRRRVPDVYAVLEETCARNAMAYSRRDVLPERFHPLTLDQLREMRAAGNVVASHTWSHRVLAHLSTHELEQELSGSKSYLETVLEEPANLLVYPFGRPKEVNSQVIAGTQRSGYKKAFVNVSWEMGEPGAMNISRSSLHRVRYRPHMHAILTGFKQAITKRRKRRRWTTSPK